MAVESAFSRAVHALSSTFTDAEVMRIGAPVNSNSETLSDYCAGGEGIIMENSKVEANWRSLGIHYPGVIQKTNSDGTYDIMYDDGWLEKGVPADLVRPLDSKSVKKVPPKDDPACQLEKTVVGLEKEAKDLSKDLTAWSAGQRAKRMADKVKTLIPAKLQVYKPPMMIPAGFRSQHCS